MEEQLTMEELYALLEGMQRAEHRRNKFAAAIKGIDLDDDKKSDTFDDIKMKADAHLAGKEESEFVFNMIGIEVEDDDDD